MGKGRYPALIHCFTASQDFADKVLALGLYVSISGIVTFKNAQRPAGGGEDDPARPAADRDRFALPRAGAASRPALRARLRRRHGALPRRACAASRSRRWPRRTSANFRTPVRQGRGVKVRILGCGTSSGVPRVGNDWGQCDRDEPRNRRRRASILVELRPRAGSWSTPARTCASNCSTPTSATSRR